MNDYRRKNIVRATNALKKAVDGCQNADCPFGDGSGTAENVCECGETARQILNQLEKEFKAVGI